MEKPITYWEKIYLQHSKSDLFKRKVDKSVEVINDFIDLKVKSYGSISAGKDSTAMMHLIYLLDSDFKFVTEKDDMDFPEEIPYIKNLQSKGYNIEIISHEDNLWDEISNYDFCEDIHSKGTDFSDKYFYGLLKKYQTENNYKGVFLGLRTQESKARLWNFKTKGHIYYNKTWKQIVCQPLANWTAKDVFAFLFSEDLPILNVYFQTKFVDSPEDIRKSWILPSAQASSGQALWLKFYYPEIFQKLCLKNPQLKSYV